MDAMYGFRLIDTWLFTFGGCNTLFLNQIFVITQAITLHH